MSVITPAETRNGIANELAFVDDSAGSRAGRILLLSASIHAYPKWSAFSVDWDKCLHASPRIDSFHMRDARALEKHFAGWNPIERDLKIISLTDVIVRHEPHVVTCWLNTDDYVELIRPVAPTDLRHAYFICFQTIVQKVAEYQKMRGIAVPTDYVFDEEGDIGNEALLWYPAMRETAPLNIGLLMGGPPDFRKDEEVLPLQAADLIAWHKRRRIEFPGLDPGAAATLRIDDLPGAEVQITREWLNGVGERIAKVPEVQKFHDGPSVYKKLKHAYKKGKTEI
jgi:hypothetical protein